MFSGALHEGWVVFLKPNAMQHFQRLILMFVVGLFMLPGPEADATHLLGSEIYYQRDTVNKVRVILKIYRKCCEDANAKCAPANPADLGGASLSVEELCPGGGNSSVSMNQDSVVDVTPSCDEGCSQCGLEGDNTPPCPPEAINPSDPNYDPDLVYDFGIEVYFFSTVITVDTSQCANYRFSWSDCCRNGDITTGVTGGYYTEATADLSVINNSPKFNESPVMITCAGQDYIDAQTAVDQDRDAQGRPADSIRYAITEPQDNSGPLSYSAPYNFREPLSYVGAGPQFNPGERRMPSAPLPPNYPEIDFRPIKGFILDSATGELFFHPTQAGERSVIAMVVKEFRNGKKISELTRDFQIIVNGACPDNNAPNIYGKDGSSNPGISNFEVQACEGAPLQLNIIVHDEDYFRIASRLGKPGAKDSVKVGFETNAPGAKVRVRPSSNNKSIAIVHFTWTPRRKHISSRPYTLTIRAEDDYCQPSASSRRSFRIYVNSASPTRADVTVSPIGCLEAQALGVQTDTANAPAPPIVRYQWRLTDTLRGDTVAFNRPGQPQSRSSALTTDTLRYSFARGGRKFWRLVMRNADGCRDTLRGQLRLPEPVQQQADTGDTAVCDNETMLLRVRIDSGSPPYRVAWRSARLGALRTDTVSGLSTYRYRPDSGQTADTLWVRTTDQIGCADSADTLIIQIRPAPNASFALRQDSNRIQLSANDTTLTAYRWAFGNGDSARGQGARYTYAQNGAYTVSLATRNQDGCADTSRQRVQVQLSSLASGTGNPGIQVFPNPVRQSLQVHWCHPAEAPKTIGLYTMDGRRLYQVQPGSHGGVRSLRIPTEALPSGPFLLQLNTREGIRRLQLMKE